ncbi:MAG: hypothetical protein Q9164_000841 [Protoblastenia rupestris]
MPIPILADIASRGIGNLPFVLPILKALPLFVVLWLLKQFFGGANNTSERLMRSKVVMITGGTSGVGAAVAQDLAARGAQLILLTHHALSDPFVVDYLEDLRMISNNELIYAEHVDLSSLHSIRTFATKWVDNAPPRRLDMVILCADTLTPRYGVSAKTHDQLELVWGINYLANFHLLSILSPALRAQPPDRDVRILISTCSSYIGGDLRALKDDRDPLPKGRKYETSKLACMVFANAFQKLLDNYKRPDNQPNNVRVIMVDPGFTRTPGMRRWLSMGSLWGLLLYLTALPLWWLVLKSPIQGAQGYLRAAMEAELGRGVGGRLLRECKEVEYRKPEVKEEAVQKRLWDFSEKQIQALEKEGAVKRAMTKKRGETGSSVSKEIELDNEKQATDTEPLKGERKNGSRRSRKTA